MTTQVISYHHSGRWLEDEQSKDVITAEIVAEMDRTAGQVLVFCGSKPKACHTAAALAGIADTNDADQVGIEALKHRVGLHFRGLASLAEAEKRFRARDIPVLVATTTLAQGVNLPARTVVIRDTTLGKDPMTTGDALQMAGRAGRFGQETEGFAFVLVPEGQVADWRRRLADGHVVHSAMAGRLADHVLAEVLLGRIRSPPPICAAGTRGPSPRSKPGWMALLGASTRRSAL